MTNSFTGASVVAYQCGTPQPDVSGATAYVSVPITASAVTSTTHIPWVELLGERKSLVAYTSDFSYVSSACLNDMYEDGVTVQAYAGWARDDAMLADLSVDVTFADSWSASAYNAVVLTPEQETTVLGSMEYIKLFGFFFNREAKANELATEIAWRYECTAANVIAAHETTPKVLLAYLSTDGSGNSGWVVGSCPNYYCETIEAAGGEMITTDITGSALVWSYYYYLNNSEFLSVARDADVWLVPGVNFTETLAAERETVSQIKAFTNNQVYDSMNRGSNDWYESRIAAPEAFLEDVVAILHPDVEPDHEMVWFREAHAAPAGLNDTCVRYGQRQPLISDSCVYNPTAAPTPKPTVAAGAPTAAPTRTPSVALSLTMAGLACSDYGTVEESVLNLALGDVLPRWGRGRAAACHMIHHACHVRIGSLPNKSPGACVTVRLRALSLPLPPPPPRAVRRSARTRATTGRGA